MRMSAGPRYDKESFSHCPGPTFDPGIFTAFPVDSIKALIIGLFSVNVACLIYQEGIAMFAFNKGCFFTKTSFLSCKDSSIQGNSGGG